ncbi:MAG: translation initiation factor IF-2 [Erysipelotrichaceae bacterium]|nr:translation initiation factor IF-2 [Erysipelotrichaceae bacterium]
MAKQNNKRDFRRSNIPNGGYNKKQENVKVNNGVFVYNRALTVGELANELKINAAEIIKFLFLNKKMVTINQTLDDETIGLICLQFGYDFRKEKLVSEENFEEMEIVDKPEDLKSRAPIVTIMGHVDHGKTTLIDAIRNSRLVDSEVGGISQAIGAYQKEIDGHKITFLDTPGHEAFTAMRSRGAAVTDIVVLVVAADDGVMPQTIEAIDHAKAAGVPIIVAINKIDKDGANVERIKSELMNYDIIPEEYGGDTICCEISAKKNIGIKELLEAIIVVSEMLELKANPDRYAIGTVIEAKLDKGEGPKATLLVQNGSLTTQDYVVVGTAYGKIRRMTNEYKKIVKVATPSTPVSVIGLSEVPNAGDHFMAFPTEKQAKEIAFKRQLIKKQEEQNASGGMTLDDLYNRIHEGETQIVNLIVKADTTGSAEAIKSSLVKLCNEQVKLNIIHCTAGAITDSDIMLASASGAIIYGFNVRPSSLISQKAEQQKVEIRLYRIIYDLLNEMEAAMKGMLKKEIVERVTGQAEVRSLIKISKIGTVAGCYVTSGSIKANSLIRLIRDGIIVYEGKIKSLKRFKDDAKEVKEGFECGINIENFNDIRENDIIEGYEMVEKE